MASNSSRRKNAAPAKVKSKSVKSDLADSKTLLDKFLGPYPIMEGEDPAAYAGLLAEVRRQAAPKDIIEEIYVRDIVDLTWELLRARKIKVALLHKGQVRAVQQFLNSGNRVQFDYEDKKNISAALAKGLSHAVSMLNKSGITVQEINAHAFSLEREALQLIDQNMVQVEARRNFTIREIEKRRSSLAERMASSLNEVEADYTEVKTEKSSQRIETG